MASIGENTPHAPRTPSGLGRLLTLIGCALTLQTIPAAHAKRSVPPSRTRGDATAPWIEARGTAPLPLAPARVTPASHAWKTHPVLHPERRPLPPVVRPLFPRAADQQREKEARAAAMRRHPAGRARAPEGSTSAIRQPDSEVRRADGCAGPTHIVRPGDTLWDIAADAMRSSSPSRIDREATALYRKNREVIGSNPDIILPGQVLKLDRTCE